MCRSLGRQLFYDSGCAECISAVDHTSVYRQVALADAVKQDVAQVAVSFELAIEELPLGFEALS